MLENSPKKFSLKRLFQGALFLLVATIAAYFQHNGAANSDDLSALYAAQANDVLVKFEADVVRILADDNQGSRHQKFIVENRGHTVLIAHNIDLAPRVPVKVDDVVIIKGEYEWNDRGGVVHWTHHDPQKRRAGGWIELNGKKYK